MVKADSAAQLWELAVALQDELPALRDDILLKWEEFSQAASRTRATLELLAR